MHERRKSPRLDESWQVTYRVMDSEGWSPPVQQNTINISGGGLCFASNEQLSPETLITFELFCERKSMHLAGLAKIMWCEPKQGTYENGAVFCWHEWACDAAPQAIHDYVVSQSPAETSVTYTYP